jgi:hypothetical protein
LINRLLEARVASPAPTAKGARPSRHHRFDIMDELFPRLGQVNDAAPPFPWIDDRLHQSHPRPAVAMVAESAETLRETEA